MRAVRGIGLAAVLLAAACSGDPPPGKTFFERQVQPILLQSCSGNTSGCHRTNLDDPFSFAAGNLDVTTFENISRRRDVLTKFGAYPIPLLLVKAVGPGQVQFAYGSMFKDLQVLHGGGAVIDVGSPAYFTLLTWLENGATENGLPPASPALSGEGACSTAVPADFDPTPVIADPNFATFKNDIQPILGSCASGSCHGAPQADFYITCGSDDTQLAFNFSQAHAFVNAPVDESQILRVPLAVAAGGGPHTGGDRFTSTTDGDYVKLRTWAQAVGTIEFGAGDPAKQFFAANVQPLLVQRGCAFAGCHSPEATNDFKLRSGTQGFFSAVSLQRNYDLLRDDFMAIEFPDARRGRAVAKTIVPGAGGIGHRGGPVLETAGAGLSSPASCPTTFDAATASAFCTVQQWVDLERAARLTAGEVSPMDDGDTLPVVYVERKVTDMAGRLEFDTYQPGADLKVATAHLGTFGAVQSVDGATSLLGGCGVTIANADVQAPDVGPDGVTVVFAMRTSATDPLGVWKVNVDGSGCQRLTPAAADQNGLKVHNFDPAWSPDGEAIVFASTRGGSGGPTRSRKRFLPQSDIWRMPAGGGDAEQMTFLSNSEVEPQTMREGRIIMTTEKVSAGFYQLAGRRINWDRTDYHPLLAQRATSLYADPDDLTSTAPSVGFAQATDIREGSDGNFLVILSEPEVRGGGGAFATFNRSVGPFEAGRTDPGFLAAMRIVDPAATGRGPATTGMYRAPSTMPDGRILVSYTGFAGDPASVTSLDWDLVAIDPRTGQRTVLLGGGDGKAQVDAVLAYKYPKRVLFLNRRQLVFGGSVDASLGARAVLHMPDAPMTFTLLTANLRKAHPVDAFRRATRFAVYREGTVPTGTMTGTGPGGIFESRTLLGSVPLAADGSFKGELPAEEGLVFALTDDDGNVIVTMTEEHQLGPGEVTTMGVTQELFDPVCSGCHGSVSGSELDVHVSPDALTGASASLSATRAPVAVDN